MAPKLAKLMSKGEEIMTKDKAQLEETEGRRKASKAPNRVKVAILPKEKLSKSLDHRARRPNSKKGILKFPAIKFIDANKEDADGKCIDKITDDNTRQNAGLPLFGRAGVERIWEQRAKQFHSSQVE